MNNLDLWQKIFYLRIMFVSGIPKAIEIQFKIEKMFAEADIQHKFELFFRGT